MWNELSNLSPTTIIFGGLTLGLISAIYVIYKIVTNHGHDWSKSMDRNSDAFIENAKSNVALIDALHDLKDEIRSDKRKK